MTGFLGKLFGKKKEKSSGGPEGLVEDVLGQIVQLGQFDLNYDIKGLDDTGTIHVEISGADEELLTSKEGQLLDALQLYVRRAVQHQLPEQNINVNLDCANFREQANEALIALAEKLKGIALTKGKSVYFRALPPKDRKVIHQYLAEDGRVKSRSIGDGHFKKIKIYPVKSNEGSAEESETLDDSFGNR
jgi:spoIIIJ-associated protein